MTQVDFVNTSVTLGELMRAQRRDAVRAFAVFLAVVLYAAVLVYTGVHNFNLLSRTVPPDQRFFAIIALLCLEGRQCSCRWRSISGWRPARSAWSATSYTG